MSKQRAIGYDPEEAIDAALAALDHSVLEAKVYDDKIGLYLAATASGIRAQRAVSDSLKLTITGFTDEVGQIVRQSPPAVFTDDQIDKLSQGLARSCQAWAGRLVGSQDKRSDAIRYASMGGAALVGVMLGVTVMLYWPINLSCNANYLNRPICYRFNGPEFPKPIAPEPPPPPADPQHSSVPANKPTTPKGKA